MTEPTPPADPAGQPTDPKDTAGDPPPDPPKPKDPKAGDPPKDSKKDEPLGDAGIKALQAERDARKELEIRLKSLEPLQKLADMLGQGEEPGKTDPVATLEERLATHETQLAEERSARWRAEIAHEKGLTAAQAARLQGTTREDLAADADELKELFPSTPGTPKPDPSQGSRSGSGMDIDARIGEAQKAGNYREVIRLQNQKLAETK